MSLNLNTLIDRTRITVASIMTHDIAMMLVTYKFRAGEEGTEAIAEAIIRRTQQGKPKLTTKDIPLMLAFQADITVQIREGGIHMYEAIDVTKAVYPKKDTKMAKVWSDQTNQLARIFGTTPAAWANEIGRKIAPPYIENALLSRTNKQRTFRLETFDA